MVAQITGVEWGIFVFGAMLGVLIGYLITSAVTAAQADWKAIRLLLVGGILAFLCGLWWTVPTLEKKLAPEQKQEVSPSK